MSALNRDAACAAVGRRVRAATDITGFGLAGHLHELALFSNTSAVIDLHAVPIIPGSDALVATFPTSNAAANRRYADAVLTSSVDASDTRAALLFDPQTSGGLLLACSPEDIGGLREDLRKAGVLDCLVGELIEPAPAGRIVVRA